MSCPICKEIDEIVEDEKKNRELHIPGYRYCGPGTKVVTRYNRGDKPINDLDDACKVHDIEYMIYNDSDKLLANSDRKLMDRASKFGGVSGFLVKNAFRGKSFLEKLGIWKPTSFAKYLTKMDPQKQKRIGNYLYNKAYNK